MKIIPGPSSTGAGLPMVTEWLEFDSLCTTERDDQVFPPSREVLITRSFHPWSAQDSLRPSAKA
jgi:hypothetical protein